MNKLRSNHHEEIVQAEAACTTAENRLAVQIRPFFSLLKQKRMRFIVGGSFLSGIALVVLPIRVWAKVGAGMGRLSARLARSPFSPLLAGMILGKVRSKNRADSEVSENFPPHSTD